MFEVTRFETRRRIDPAISMGLYVAIIAVAVVVTFPLVEGASEALGIFVDSLPVVVQTAFRIEALDTIEGLLAVQFYRIVVVLLLGMDVAYTAAGAVADQVWDGRVEFTLSGSLTRPRYLLGIAVSLLPEIVAVAALSFAAIQLGLLVVGQSVPFVPFVVAHFTMLPYLAVCAAIGLAFSVSVSDPGVAERRASLTVLGLFTLDAVTVETGWSWLGAVSPSRHYDPTAILVHGHYDVVGTLLLVVGVGVVLGIAVVIFSVRDL